VGCLETLDAGATTSSWLRPHLRSCTPDMKTFGTRFDRFQIPFHFTGPRAVYFC
jgi:hypothetical protein